MNTTNETGKSKEAETPQEAWIRIYSGDSNINSQFTIFKTGFHAGRDTGRQQSAVYKAEIERLREALLELWEDRLSDFDGDTESMSKAELKARDLISEFYQP